MSPSKLCALLGVTLVLAACSGPPAGADRRPQVRDLSTYGCDQAVSDWGISAIDPEVLKTPSGLQANLAAVWAYSGMAVWAVGSEGKVVFFNGQTWVAQQTPTKENLSAVFGTSSNDVWAAGFGGTVIHFDGTKWTDSSPPDLMFVPLEQDGGPPKGDAAVGFRRNLWGVWAAGGPPAGTQALYVVGDRGLVLYKSTTGWLRAASGVEDHLYGVWGDSASQVYAVGDFGTLLSGGVSGATGSFTKVNTRISRTLHAIWGSNGHLYAVGQNGTIIHGQGATWDDPVEGIPKQVLRSVWGPKSPSTIYVVGIDGTLMRLSGGPSFSPAKVDLFSCMTKNRLDGVFGVELPPKPPAPGQPDAGQKVEQRIWAVGVSGTIIIGP